MICKNRQKLRWGPVVLSAGSLFNDVFRTMCNFIVFPALITSTTTSHTTFPTKTGIPLLSLGYTSRYRLFSAFLNKQIRWHKFCSGWSTRSQTNTDCFLCETGPDGLPFIPLLTVWSDSSVCTPSENVTARLTVLWFITVES